MACAGQQQLLFPFLLLPFHKLGGSMGQLKALAWPRRDKMPHSANSNTSDLHAEGNAAQLVFQYLPNLDILEGECHNSRAVD